MILYLIMSLSLFFVVYFLFLNRKESFCDEDCQEDSRTIDHLKDILRTIAPEIVNYNIHSGSESVTINKEDIYICMRDPKTKKMYSFDVLLFVTLHEFAHVLSKTYSTKTHNDEFTNNFTKLLRKAYEKNFLLSTTSIPEDYCKQKPILEKFIEQIKNKLFVY